MFPYQKSCELSFQTSDAVGDQEQDNNVEDLILLDNNAQLISRNNTTNRSGRGRGRGRGRGGGRGRGRNPSSLATNYSSNNANNEDGDDNERRIIHREVERHRRQEMSNLYTSLRAALPAEYIKGKRAISDHIAETVKYIKDLEKNVKELGDRRDLLRGSSSSQEGVTNISTANFNEAGGSSNNSFLPGTVVIRPCVGGLEIEISVSCEDDGFLLSSAIRVVLEEGVDVMSCSSTRISDERLIHSLQCEVTDTTCVDVNRLQQRLIDLVC